MIRLIILFGLLFYFDFFFMNVTNKGFGRCLPMSYILFTALFLITSYTGKITNFKYVFLITCLAIFVYLFIHKKETFKKAKDLLCPSMLVFIVTFVYFYLLTKDSGFVNIDDNFYWGPRVFDVITSNKLYSNDVNNLVNSDAGYPPFATLLEVGFCKVLGTGFSQSACLFSMISFSASFFITMFDKYKFKKNHIISMVTTFIVFISLMLCVRYNDLTYNTYVINSIYVDFISAIILAYLFYIFFADCGDYFSISLSLIALLLIKQINICLYILCVVTYLLSTYVKNKKTDYKSLIAIVIPLFIFLSWNVFYKVETANLTYLTTANDLLKATVSIQQNTNKIDIVKNFIKHYFTFPIATTPINMSYFSITTISLIILILYSKKVKNNKENILTTVLFYFGSIGYAIAMMICYCFVFNESDGLSLIMFGRYMQTYSYAAIILPAMLFTIDSNNKIYSMLGLIISLIMIEPKSVGMILIEKNGRKYEDSIIVEESNYILEVCPDKDIGFINYNDLVYFYNLKLNLGSISHNIHDYSCGQFSNKDDFMQMIANYEYILIGIYTPEFETNCWNKVTNTPLYNSTLYKVVNENETYTIEMIKTFD